MLHTVGLPTDPSSLVNLQNRVLSSELVAHTRQCGRPFHSKGGYRTAFISFLNLRPASGGTAFVISTLRFL